MKNENEMTDLEVIIMIVLVIAIPLCIMIFGNEQIDHNMDYPGYFP